MYAVMASAASAAAAVAVASMPSFLLLIPLLIAAAVVAFAPSKILEPFRQQGRGRSRPVHATAVTCPCP
jgi:hypothetical protein